MALIAGPTASGKSDLAVRLALALAERGRRAVVINADSAQVYTDLQILSARPSTPDMCGVEHRLFGAWDGGTVCSAADWAAAARVEIERAHAQAGVPILVGGTGLYLRTIVDGIARIPPIDPCVREAVRALEPAAAYAALEREDPPRAAALHRNDRLRIARALEVVRSTGKPIAFWQQLNASGIQDAVALHAVILRPHLETLRARGEARFVKMVETGAADEVRALLARELSPDLPIMRAIGVREIAGWLRGAWDRDEAIRRGQQATWQYIRRQFTWLRNQPPDDWPRCETEPFDELDLFTQLLR